MLRNGMLASAALMLAPVVLLMLGAAWLVRALGA